MDPEPPGGGQAGGHPGGVRLPDHAGGRRDRAEGRGPVPAGGGGQPGQGGCVSVHPPQCRDQRRLRRRDRGLCGPKPPAAERGGAGCGVPLYRGFHRPAGQPGAASGGAEPVCAQLYHHAGHADRAGVYGLHRGHAHHPDGAVCRPSGGRAGGGSCGGV